MKKELSPIDALEATKTQADLHDLLPQELKPCVALMLEEGPPGGECDPNTTCYIIATEFRRLGKPREEALEELREWAVRTRDRGRELGPREVEKTVVSAYGGDLRTYGCGPDRPLYRSGYCMGHDACPYYKACGGRDDHDELDFYRYGWPEQIGVSAAAMYNAIRALEHERGAPRGVTWANYQQLTWRSGCSKGNVRTVLERLAHHSLITVRFGSPRAPGKQGQATRIERVLPIPEPAPRR